MRTKKTGEAALMDEIDNAQRSAAQEAEGSAIQPTASISSMSCNAAGHEDGSGEARNIKSKAVRLGARGEPSLGRAEALGNGVMSGRRMKSLFSLLERDSSTGERASWIAAIEHEDICEVKRLSIKMLEESAYPWEAGEKDLTGAWINVSLPKDLEIHRRLMSAMRAHPGRIDTIEALRGIPHLCATPLELAIVLKKPALLDGLRSEWARGRRYRGAWAYAPRWWAVTGATGDGWSRIGGHGPTRRRLDGDGTCLRDNLFLHCYLHDRRAYEALIRIGFSEESFLKGLGDAVGHPKSNSARMLAKQRGASLDPAAARSFVAERRDLAADLFEALGSLGGSRGDAGARRVGKILAKAPSVDGGSLSIAALAGRADILQGLLDGGANPNAKIGRLRAWSMAVSASPEMHRIWIESGGNPNLGEIHPAVSNSPDELSPIRAAIVGGRVDTVEAFLEGMGKWPMSVEEFEALATLARDVAAVDLRLAPELLRIERMLLERPMWEAAMEERRSIGQAAGAGSDEGAERVRSFVGRRL